MECLQTPSGSWQPNTLQWISGLKLLLSSMHIHEFHRWQFKAMKLARWLALSPRVFKSCSITEISRGSCSPPQPLLLLGHRRRKCKQSWQPAESDLTMGLNLHMQKCDAAGSHAHICAQGSPTDFNGAYFQERKHRTCSFNL